MNFWNELLLIPIRLMIRCGLRGARLVVSLVCDTIALVERKRNNKTCSTYTLGRGSIGLALVNVTPQFNPNLFVFVCPIGDGRQGLESKPRHYVRHPPCTDLIRCLLHA
jgi:hypothetical protein